jgi:hypothetical protein
MVVQNPFGYSASIETPTAKENQMNVLKHMEAIFIITLAIAGSASVVAEVLPEAKAHEVNFAMNAVASPNKMAVVTVTAKRMNAAEKLLSLAKDKVAGSGA